MSYKTQMEAAKKRHRYKRNGNRCTERANGH